MSSNAHISMHSQHRAWESDFSQWRNDLQVWKSKLSRSQTDIQRLEEALKKHGEVLDAHAATLLQEEAHCQAHEHALAEYERGGQGADLLPMVAQHDDESNRHRESHAADERLKRRNHAVIAQWRLLLAALCEEDKVGTSTKKPLLTIE